MNARTVHQRCLQRPRVAGDDSQRRFNCQTHPDHNVQRGAAVQFQGKKAHNAGEYSCNSEGFCGRGTQVDRSTFRPLQETFDAAVQENITEFDMDVSAA
jgi:hypothetical protein